MSPEGSPGGPRTRGGPIHGDLATFCKLTYVVLLHTQKPTTGSLLWREYIYLEYGRDQDGTMLRETNDR
jgi:hypothetical protein